jgi:hypothetical protein
MKKIMVKRFNPKDLQREKTKTKIIYRFCGGAMPLFFGVFVLPAPPSCVPPPSNPPIAIWAG